MNDLVQALGENRFNLDFERDFKTTEDVSGAVTLLPTLFDSCVVTTNFDRVLEQVYANAGRPFVEKVCGRGMANAFFRAIPAGERYLLKLHGNLDNAAERVLDTAEYDLAYGNDGNIHFDRPLPKLLRRLFMAYSFLFLGAVYPPTVRSRLLCVSANSKVRTTCRIITRCFRIGGTIQRDMPLNSGSPMLT